MLIEIPVDDFVDTLHVSRKVLPGDEGVADGAEQLRKFRNTLATIGCVADVIVVMTVWAVGATNLMVLHQGHGRKETAALRTGMLKEKNPISNNH
jgi:hypothetical protein